MAEPARVFDLPLMLTVREIASATRQSEYVARRKLVSGEYPGIKLGGRWLMRQDDLQAILAGRPPEPEPAPEPEPESPPAQPLTLAQQREQLVGADAIAFIRELIASADDLTESQRATVRAAFAPGPGRRPLRERVKPCTRCGEPLPLTDYGPDTRSTDGRKSCCRACESREKTARRTARQVGGEFIVEAADD
jgi:hypothetical protein